MHQLRFVSPRVLCVVCLALVAACTFEGAALQPAEPGATLFEGARLIVGDGSAPIDDSAFLVEGTRFTRVGRRGEIEPPEDAARVDLTGTTVMPALIDLHSHLGFENMAEGIMAKENFTRENLLDHLDRYAYSGHAATLSLGTDFPAFIWDVRKESLEASFTGARYLTVGRGLAWPDTGPGEPSRNDVPYPVVSEWQARTAVRELAAQEVSFVKLWVEDRGGLRDPADERRPFLTPEIIRAAIDEAHRADLRVIAHVKTLALTKELLHAGVDVITHPIQDLPVDAELLALLAERPHVWSLPVLTPASRGGSAPRVAGERPAWLEDPLLRALRCPAHLERWGASFERSGRLPSATGDLTGENTRALHAAGVRIVFGSHDAGGNRIYGWGSHMELESFVDWVGMTPHEAIMSATSVPAEILGLDLGVVAGGKGADFIVLDADPLEDISNTRRIFQVYLRGQQVDRVAMAARWEAACIAASVTE